MIVQAVGEPAGRLGNHQSEVDACRVVGGVLRGHYHYSKGRRPLFIVDRYVADVVGRRKGVVVDVVFVYGIRCFAYAVAVGVCACVVAPEIAFFPVVPLVVFRVVGVILNPPPVKLVVFLGLFGIVYKVVVEKTVVSLKWKSKPQFWVQPVMLFA